MKVLFKRLQLAPVEYFKEFYQNCPVFDEFPIDYNQPTTDWNLIASNILSKDQNDQKRFLKYVNNAQEYQNSLQCKDQILLFMLSKKQSKIINDKRLP